MRGADTRIRPGRTAVCGSRRRDNVVDTARVRTLAKFFLNNTANATYSACS